MRPRDRFVLAGAVAGLLLALAWYEARLKQKADSARAALAVGTANLEGEADRLAREIAAAKSKPAQLAAAPAAPPAPRKGKVSGGPPLSEDALIQKSPHLQALYLASQRAELGRTYGPLFRTLHLTPDQIAKYEDAMIEYRGQEMDLQGTAQAQGLGRSDPAIAALQQQADQQLQAAKAAILGDAGAQQDQEYGRTLPVRALVAQIAGTVAFSAPLTPDQSDQMTQILAAASPSYQKGGAANWNNIDYAQADRAAAAILSPAQLAAWQQAEPMGGGPSRWMATLGSRLDQAQKSRAGE